MEKRVIVIGCPGSGKSYFSKILEQNWSIPCFHLDLAYWRENWTHITRDELRLQVEEWMKNEEWIIDGNYSSTLEQRIAQCNICFYFDLPVEECIKGSLQRIGKTREDFPSFLEENKEKNDELIETIKTFKQNVDGKIQNLILKYPKIQVITFHSRKEENDWIKTNCLTKNIK